MNLFFQLKDSASVFGASAVVMYIFYNGRRETARFGVVMSIRKQEYKLDVIKHTVISSRCSLQQLISADSVQECEDVKFKKFTANNFQELFMPPEIVS